MPQPIAPGDASVATYAQDLAEWQQAFPGSVASMKGVYQDGVQVESGPSAYECGTDREVDAAVCTGGVANPDAGIVEIHDLSSPADVARRTEQTHGWTLETFTRWWNQTHYTSRGLPVPESTPESQARIATAYLQQQATDSTRVLHNWNEMDNNARAGNLIGEGVVIGATSFIPAGMFIDNPALLARSLIAAKVAPMLTSSGGPDGGMGSVISVEAAMAAPGSTTQAAGSLENRAIASAEKAWAQQEASAGSAAVEEARTGASGAAQAGGAASGAARPGINWNPLRAPSLDRYLPNAGNVSVVGATRNGNKAVDFLQLEANNGGRIFAATDKITGDHVDKLANNLLSGNLAQGKNIVIITGRHGTTAGFDLGMRDSRFLMEDFVIAPAAKNIEVLDAFQLTSEQMQAVLQRGDDVILAWCNSENSRQVMNALGVNFKFAPF